MYDIRTSTTVYLKPEQEFPVRFVNDTYTAKVVRRNEQDAEVYVYCYRTFKNGRTTQAKHVRTMFVEDLPEPLQAALAEARRG